MWIFPAPFVVAKSRRARCSGSCTPAASSGLRPSQLDSWECWRCLEVTSQCETWHFSMTLWWDFDCMGFIMGFIMGVFGSVWWDFECFFFKYFDGISKAIKIHPFQNIRVNWDGKWWGDVDATMSAVLAMSEIVATNGIQAHRIHVWYIC